MITELMIKCSTDDIPHFQTQYLKFCALSAEERYNIIKDMILSSDRVVFFNMTGSFMYGTKESPCMELLKKHSEEHSSFAIDWFGMIEKVHEGMCFSLDISNDDKKKLFLDNYRFYDHTNFEAELPELRTSFTVSDDRSYEPYSFYFLSNMKLKMLIEHHTREVGIFEDLAI